LIKRLIRNSFRIKHYTLAENLISGLIGTVIALLIILFNYEEIFAVELVDATGYCCGSIGSRGDKLEVGYCAYRPEDYGEVVAIYEAHDHEGDYKIGEFIGYLEIKDTGYGKPTGYGQSDIIEGKTVGTIESGKQIDVYFPTYQECKKFMKDTGGKVFILKVEGRG